MMKMKFNKNTWLLLLLCCLTVSSCTEWLDVDPVSEIGADQLFATKEGFDVAINGVYMSLASKELYGGELNYGAIELMSRSSRSQGNTDMAFMDHDYEYEGVKSRISSVWGRSFNLIANCNKLIEELDKKDDTFFSEYEYDQYMGQAIAARAITYFNLARLFAPYHLREDVAIIPYTTKLSPVAGPKLKTSVIIDSVVKDLMKSRELLAKMDTLELMKFKMANKNNRFEYSLAGGDKAIGFRFNYMAVTALLARVALWNEDNDLALSMASEAYGKWGVQPELKTTIAKNKHDRLLSYGMYMGLFTSELDNYYQTSINGDMHSIANIKEVFPDLDGDYRYSKLIEEVKTNEFQSIKYSDENLGNGVVVNMVPVVRVAEMVYIIAELLYDKNPDMALYWVNWLRQRRGAVASYCPTSMPDKESFVEYLMGEIRKEFIGEGQFFFYYKRLNLPIKDESIYGEEGKWMTEESFTWPIPESELIN